MYSGKLVFAQLMEHLPLHTFRRCVARYPRFAFRISINTCAWSSRS